LRPLEVFRLEKQRIVAGHLPLHPRHCLNCAAIGFESSDKISSQDPAAKVVLQGFLRNETPDHFPLDHGAKPVAAYDDAMVVAEILALPVRSRVEKSIQQTDIRLPAIQAMLQRIASTGSHEHAEPGPPLNLTTTAEYAEPISRTPWRRRM